ncbi:hypothetical protein F4604DRAFT_2018411 [Suillus subluteus]|nr:hypothetical protein F4604DRAFT_2018411 [Suillus subluteus]
MLRVVRRSFHPAITPRSWEGQSIRLEVISGKNLKVPSKRIPAGIYMSLNVDPRRPWKSTTGVLSSDESVAWAETVTLTLDASPKLTLVLWASFELDRMLGNGEVIGKLEISWDELLDRGNEPFVLSFPRVRGVRPSLTLKATVLHARDSQDGVSFDFIVDCEIARDTDAGHAQLTEYVTRTLKWISYLNDAVEHFQLVLDQCPVSHSDYAAALTNLAWARLRGYIQNDLQDINSITSLFREALALRPQGHLDHPLSIYHLTEALTWRYRKEHTAVYIHESAQLSCKLLNLCPEGSYLRSIATGADGVDYAVERRFQQHGSIDDLDECIQCCREAVSLFPEEHSERETYLNNLALSLKFRFDYQGNSHDLNEAISLHEEALRSRPVGHKIRDFSLDNLGAALLACFHQCGDANDVTRSMSLRCEALTLHPPGSPYRDSTLNNLAGVLRARYVELDTSEDLNESIDLFRDSLHLRQHGHPLRHTTLYNLSSVLCLRFIKTQKNEDIEEAIRLCQESLEVLPSLHPDRFFSYVWLQAAYLSCYRVQHNLANLSLAVDNFRLASRHPTQGFPYRILAAQEWVTASERHNHTSALEAYKFFFELLGRHLATWSLIVAWHEATSAFRHTRTLPVDAAACAMHLDNLQNAIELVEQGR